MPGQKESSARSPPLTSAKVRHAAGEVSGATVAAVLECGLPSQEELEVAASYLRGEGSEVDRQGHPLAGKVAQLYDILSADALYAEAE